MLVIKRIRDEQRADHTAHNVRAMDARPEQDTLQRDDDNTAAQRIRKPLKRRLDDLKNAFRQRRRADVVEQAVDDGGAGEENHARHECGESTSHALGYGFRHLDGQVVLLAVAEDIRNGKGKENGRDDAVAARPGFRNDIAHCLAAFRDQRRRHHDEKYRKGQNRSHHGVASLVLHKLVGDGQNHDECQHAERAACDRVERCSPIRTEDTRHKRRIARHRQIGQQQEHRAADRERCRRDEAVTQRRDDAQLGEHPHKFNKLIKQRLLIHFLIPL